MGLLFVTAGCDDATPATQDTDDEPEEECVGYTAPRYSGRLPTEVNEASGIAISRTYEGVGWLHNDSGDDATIYAVDLASGELIAALTLGGATATDWEDMSIADCGGDLDGDCLFVGDIGDNGRRRERLTIFRVPEPDPHQAQSPVDTWDAMDFRYADEPRDAESLFVADDQLYILSKEWDNEGTSVIYAFAFEPGSGDEPSAVSPLQTYTYSGFSRAASTLATAADYRDDPRSLAIRSYGSLVEYRGEGDESVLELLALDPEVLRTGAEIQAEAVGYAPDGAIWHTSEGTRTPIYELPACE